MIKTDMKDQLVLQLWESQHENGLQLKVLLDQVRLHDESAKDHILKSEAEREEATRKIKDALTAAYKDINASATGHAAATDAEREREMMYSISRECRNKFDAMRSRLKKDIEEADLDPLVKRAKQGFVAFAKSCRKSKRTLVAEKNKYKFYVGPSGLGMTRHIVAKPVSEWTMSTVMEASTELIAGLRENKMNDCADTLEQFMVFWTEIGLASNQDGIKIRWDFEQPREICNNEGVMVKVTAVVLESYGNPNYIDENGGSHNTRDSMEHVCVYELVKDKMESEELRLRKQLQDAHAKGEEMLAKVIDIVGPYMLSQEL